MSDNIKSILCMPPNDSYYVAGKAGITKIDDYMEDLGEYGIKWYRIYQGDFVIAKVNALHVQEVDFIKPVATQDDKLGR